MPVPLPERWPGWRPPPLQIFGGEVTQSEFWAALLRAAAIIVVAGLVGLAVALGQRGAWPPMAATTTVAVLSVAELYHSRASRE